MGIFRTILCLVIGALGCLILYFAWSGIFAYETTVLNFFLSLFISALVIGVAAPIIAFIVTIDFGLALQILLRGSLPFAIITFVLVLDVGMFTGFFSGERDGLETFVNVIFFIAISVLLTSLAVALVLLLEFLPAACVVVLHRISLPSLLVGGGMALWAWLFAYRIQMEPYDTFEKVIHTIGISVAILGVVVALITLVEGVPLVSGFCIGLAAAIVFLNYLIFGLVLLVKLTEEHYAYVLLGIAGFYSLLGAIYGISRFKKIKQFVIEGRKLYWHE